MIAGAPPALAFPALSWWWLAWVGLVPLLLVVRAAPTAMQGAVRAWVGMTGFVLITQYWLWPAAGPLLIVLAVGLGTLWLPWGWAAHRLLSGEHTICRVVAAVVVLPSWWVLAEAARSWDKLGGPWTLLGASQWNQPATLASASVGGVWLVSFLIVAVNTAVVGALLVRTAWLVALPIALAIVSPAWFWWGPAPAEGSSVRIALVQPGDIEDATARQAAGEALTETLAGQQLDLVVWGESSVGVDLGSHPDAMARLVELRRRIGADLLVNVDARAPSGGIYKSSVLIGPSGALGSYSKTRLVPFGEYVPLRPLLGWATSHTKAAAEDRRRGDGPAVLHADSLAVGPLISFEATFS
ncbi:MAG TPA: apolipoprotein N-acyltransferase, partial [Mycobacterium sp.]